MGLRNVDEVRFLAHVFDHIDTSKSQIIQDLWVTFETREKRNGFFVEFGATNGLTNSNTWLLETAFGWNGILAEPNPVWQSDLQQTRKCHIDFRCVFSQSGDTVSLLTTSEDPELSSIDATSGRDHFASVRSNAETVPVKTVSLNDLLEEYNAPEQIDYLSVDTEGSELEILENFDFKRRNISLISVEHNNTPQENLIDKLLVDNGFMRRFPEYSQWDSWYVNNKNHQ
ncbi:MAG: FkbM family methyltransferase [Beijerinckiaceae bacterium]